jgi:SAM-dependent methyltransferase
MTEQYFEKAKYRLPQHPVIEAYVRPKLDYIQQRVPLNRTTSLLDVGCGNGVFTYYFQQLCGLVTGVDNSRNMLAENPCRSVVQSEATHLPFPDSSFDVVFEANLLHHVEDRSRVVREMSRVSRQWVILIEPNRNNPLMLGFGLVVPAERGLLTSTRSSNLSLLHNTGLKTVACMTTGMISQNNTPLFVLPLLRRFDREIWYGEYVILIAQKPASHQETRDGLPVCVGALQGDADSLGATATQ